MLYAYKEKASAASTASRAPLHQVYADEVS
jgi:hypothetical protein